MEPRASVIIVGYNGRRYIDSCLSAVLDQSWSAAQYEVIYVDNGSADSPIPDIQTRYPAVRTIQLAHNLGFAAGNNQATTYARGDVLLFLNQDTVAHYQWVEQMVAALSTDDQLGAVYANQIMPVDPEFAATDRHSPPQRANLWQLSPAGYARRLSYPPDQNLKPALALSGGAFGLRRATLACLEYLFDAAYGSYGEDTDLGLRLQLSGYGVALAPQAVVFHATGSGLHNPGGEWQLIMAMRMALRVTRNRVVTYFKVLDAAEFLLFLPALLLGAPAKAWQWRVAWPWRVAAVLAFIPLTALGWLWALLTLPAYRAQRRRLQAQRRAPRFWLQRRLAAIWLSL